jgi:hypothetical protein
VWKPFLPILFLMLELMRDISRVLLLSFGSSQSCFNCCTFSCSSCKICCKLSRLFLFLILVNFFVFLNVVHSIAIVRSSFLLVAKCSMICTVQNRVWNRLDVKFRRCWHTESGMYDTNGRHRVVYGHMNRLVIYIFLIFCFCLSLFLSSIVLSHCIQHQK